MEIRQIPMPKNTPDPENKTYKQEVKDIFDDYKRQKSNPIQPQSTEPVYVKPDVTIAVRDLPSKMLPYPTGSSIKFKPYTYGDLQFFSSSDLTEEDRIKFILDGIITEGFDKSNLAFQDFLFIAVLRKLTAWDDSKFTYNFICDECGESNKTTSKLSEIEFKDLELPSLPLIIDVDDKTTLLLNPLTVGATLKLRNVQEDKYLRAYSECVINMPAKQAFELIKSIKGDLIDVLELADSMLGFGEQSIDCICTHCKTKNTFALAEVQSLLQPFHRERELTQSRIRFV